MKKDFEIQQFYRIVDTFRTAENFASDITQSKLLSKTYGLLIRTVYSQKSIQFPTFASVKFSPVVRLSKYAAVIIMPLKYMLLLRVNQNIFGVWFGTHLMIASEVGFVAKAQYEFRCTKYGYIENRYILNIIALVLFN